LSDTIAITGHSRFQKIFFAQFEDFDALDVNVSLTYELPPAINTSAQQPLKFQMRPRLLLLFLCAIVIAWVSFAELTFMNLTKQFVENNGD